MVLLLLLLLLRSVCCVQTGDTNRRHPLAPSTTTPKPSPLQDFASGYLFGRLFAALGLQPDFDAAFVAGDRPATCLANHERLRPTFARLGVKYDAREARAVLRREPGRAARLLAAARAAVADVDAGARAVDHAAPSMQRLTVRASASRHPAGRLASVAPSAAKAAHAASAASGFDVAMRRASADPNRLLEAAHLRAFYDGERTPRGGGKGRALCFITPRILLPSAHTHTHRRKSHPPPPSFPLPP